MDFNPHYYKTRSEANSAITYTIMNGRQLLLAPVHNSTSVTSQQRLTTLSGFKSSVLDRRKRMTQICLNVSNNDEKGKKIAPPPLPLPPRVYLIDLSGSCEISLFTVCYYQLINGRSLLLAEIVANPVRADMLSCFYYICQARQMKVFN